ncbi:MAG TPA: class I SAM-dependent methyltransferase [Dehalococcoidia bacterium]|nr:class I SAM-dependent methyltransferase [Dehalococcoidia bacterium]
MTTYSDYDPFASIYNKYWGDDFTPRVFPILEQMVLRQLPTGAPILDLCCGTGQLAGTLTALGYRVTGLDGSPEMLKFAHENAPDAEFIKADARTFELPEQYDAVVSVFDSLNHVMSLEELTAVFRNVFAVLRESGYFFFDLNMEAGYGLTWNDNFGIVEDDHLCIVRTSYDPDEKVARFDTTIMLLEDDWKRKDITLFQKCYPAAEVISALENAGFVSIDSYSHHEREGLTGLTGDADRGFFICRKSSSGSPHTKST